MQASNQLSLDCDGEDKVSSMTRLSGSGDGHLDDEYKNSKIKEVLEFSDIESQQTVTTLKSYLLHPFKIVANATSDIVRLSLNHPKVAGMLLLSVSSQLLLVAAKTCNCWCTRNRVTVFPIGAANDVSHCITRCDHRYDAAFHKCESL